MKRLIAALIAVFAGGGGAWADTWTDEDGHVWTYGTNAVSATISAVTEAEYDMEIPAMLGDKPVVAFGTIFYNNTKISSVVIPNSVTAIAAQAFDGCSQLQRVTVGSGVTRVGNYAFRNCALLQKIELPEATTQLGIGAFASCVKLNMAKLPGVTSIPGAGDGYGPGSQYFNGYGSFYGCDKLRTLQLSTNLTYIGRGAFYNCNELYDLVIPDSVASIDNYAFAECDKLHNLTLGSGLVGVGYRTFLNDTQLETLVFRGTSVNWLAAEAFRNCQNLRAINLPNGLNWIGESCFRNCDSIPEVVIPDTVTVCTNGAFAYCDGLKSIKLGSGLTHIAGSGDGYSPGSQYFDGYGLFHGCTALTNVVFNETLKTIGNGAFYGCSALPAITIPQKVTSIGAYAFSACGLLQDVIIGDSVRLIKHHAFYGDAKLETLKLGAKVQTIEYCAFQSCTALKSFSFPETVLTIGDWCFNSCRMLSSLVLPDSVGVIGVGSFSGCTGLKSVKIGDGLEEISGSGDGYSPGSQYFDNYGAFANCTGLTEVEVGSSVFTIGNGAFYGCSALPSITIPSNVSSIKSYAFAANTALTTVDIKNGGVTSIGNYAFYGDSALTTAHLGDRLVTIGTCAFQYCTKLTGLVLPESLVTIGSWSFGDCKALESIVIPDKVKDLNPGAFAACTGLTSAKIGRSLANIGGASDGYSPGSQYFNSYGAFYGCTALRSVDFGSTLTTISGGAFYGCSSLAAIDIPDSVTKIGDYAFGACTSLATADLGAGIVTLGRYVFNGDTALHYVTFAGDEAPVNVGASIFNGTKDRMTVYVKDGSVGWPALHVGGLPDSGTWQGRPIAYAPPPKGADNPYDFYPYVRTDSMNYRNYVWSAPVIITTAPYVYGRTIPTSVETVCDDETVYLSYCFDEYWRGEAFCVTNTFTLTGAKTGAFRQGCNCEAHSSTPHWWVTNALPKVLQGLPVGDYALTCTLNSDRRLAETDYSNNTTSITFKVVAAPLYDVTFNPNGGTVAEASRQVKRNTAVGELPEPTREGYAFNGWFTRASGGVQVFADTLVTAASVTYYAHWTALPRYTIKFNANGGSSDSTRSLYEGTPLGELPKVTRDGYVLAGWFTAAEGGTEITAATVATASVTYYAHWRSTAYTVQYHKYDGSGATRDQSFKEGATQRLLWMDSQLKWMRSGYEFVGWVPWNPDTKPRLCKYVNGQEVKDIAKGGEILHLYAAWKSASSYRVCFHRNYDSGDATKMNQVILRNKEDNLAWMDSMIGWTRNGYTFAGWGESDKATTVKYANGAKVKNLAMDGGTKHLYAVWRPTGYTVQYHKYDGSGETRDQLFKGGVAQKLLWMDSQLKWTRSGYEFIGWVPWNPDAKARLCKYENGQEVKDIAKAGETLHLYAAWKSASSYRVCFHRNYDSGDATKMNQVILRNKEDNLAWMDSQIGWKRDGYVFRGWAETEKGAVKYANGAKVKNLAMDGGTKHLYAVWRVETAATQSATAASNHVLALSCPSTPQSEVGSLFCVGELFGGDGSFVLVMEGDALADEMPAVLMVDAEEWDFNGSCTVVRDGNALRIFVDDEERFFALSDEKGGGILFVIE